MTNRRSPVLTCCPSVKARFCRKPSTRDTRMTVLTAWTRATKVPAGVTLFRATAVTVTAGGVAAADSWSEVEDRPQPQSAAATRMIVPRIAPQGRRRILEFLPFTGAAKTRGASKRPRSVPWTAKRCQLTLICMRVRKRFRRRRASLGKCPPQNRLRLMQARDRPREGVVTPTWIDAARVWKALKLRRSARGPAPMTKQNEKGGPNGAVDAVSADRP